MHFETTALYKGGDEKGVWPDWSQDVSAQYETVDNVYLGSSYIPAFNGRWTIDTGVSYSHRTYDTGIADDDYEFKTTWENRVKDWMTFAAGYIYRTRVSSVGESSYDNNIFLLRLTMEY